MGFLTNVVNRFNPRGSTMGDCGSCVFVMLSDVAWWDMNTSIDDPDWNTVQILKLIGGRVNWYDINARVRNVASIDISGDTDILFSELLRKKYTESLECLVKEMSKKLPASVTTGVGAKKAEEVRRAIHGGAVLAVRGTKDGVIGIYGLAGTFAGNVAGSIRNAAATSAEAMGSAFATVAEGANDAASHAALRLAHIGDKIFENACFAGSRLVDTLCICIAIGFIGGVGYLIVKWNKGIDAVCARQIRRCGRSMTSIVDSHENLSCLYCRGATRISYSPSMAQVNTPMMRCWGCMMASKPAMNDVWLHASAMDRAMGVINRHKIMADWTAPSEVHATHGAVLREIPASLIDRTRHAEVILLIAALNATTDRVTCYSHDGNGVPSPVAPFQGGGSQAQTGRLMSASLPTQTDDVPVPPPAAAAAGGGGGGGTVNPPGVLAVPAPAPRCSSALGWIMPSWRRSAPAAPAAAQGGTITPAVAGVAAPVATAVPPCHFGPAPQTPAAAPARQEPTLPPALGAGAPAQAAVPYFMCTAPVAAATPAAPTLVAAPPSVTNGGSNFSPPGILPHTGHNEQEDHLLASLIREVAFLSRAVSAMKEDNGQATRAQPEACATPAQASTASSAASSSGQKGASAEPKTEAGPTPGGASSGTPAADTTTGGGLVASPVCQVCKRSCDRTDTFCGHSIGECCLGKQWFSPTGRLGPLSFANSLISSYLGDGSDILPFYGHAVGKPHREFSNFYEHDIPYTFTMPSWLQREGFEPSFQCRFSEKAIMACKAAMFNDRGCYGLILATTTPQDCKALGRLVVGFREKEWLSRVRNVALEVIYQKFMSSEELRFLLLSTGNRTIVEAAKHDTLWGAGLARDDVRIYDQSQWLGQNVLGEALGLVRDGIRLGAPSVAAYYAALMLENAALSAGGGVLPDGRVPFRAIPRTPTISRAVYDRTIPVGVRRYLEDCERLGLDGSIGVAGRIFEPLSWQRTFGDHLQPVLQGPYRPYARSAASDALDHEPEDEHHNFRPAPVAYPTHDGLPITAAALSALYREHQEQRDYVPHPETEAVRDIMAGYPEPQTASESSDIGTMD